MIIRFDHETIAMINNMSDNVAKKLAVDCATLCIATGRNAVSEKVELCFETAEDDTFSAVSVDVDNISSVISNWMSEPGVRWMKREHEIK
jgi:hypothetical protein